MNVSLTPELEASIRKRVDSGRYTSSSEVVREALRLLEDRDELLRLRLADVRVKVAQGLASLDAGEGIDGNEFFNDLLAAAPSQE